jgi:hypothetical protein
VKAGLFEQERALLAMRGALNTIGTTFGVSDPLAWKNKTSEIRTKVQTIEAVAKCSKDVVDKLNNMVPADTSEKRLGYVVGRPEPCNADVEGRVEQLIEISTKSINEEKNSLVEIIRTVIMNLKIYAPNSVRADIIPQLSTNTDHLKSVVESSVATLVSKLKEMDNLERVHATLVRSLTSFFGSENPDDMEIDIPKNEEDLRNLAAQVAKYVNAKRARLAKHERLCDDFVRIFNSTEKQDSQKIRPLEGVITEDVLDKYLELIFGRLGKVWIEYAAES